MTYEEFLKIWRNPDEDFIIAHTSGSTGRPKEIHLPKSLVAASAARTIEFFHISANSHIHSVISPDFIGGKMAAVRADISGALFTYEPPSNAPLIFGDGHPGRWPDLISVVPSQMLYIVDNFKDIPSTVNFLVGGSAIHPRLARMIEERRLNGWESYGMTETASHIALRKISASPKPFTPLKGVDISLDKRGCLIISLAYSPQIVTNDMARIYEDGSFEILGRFDNVIISGGKKIFPEDVESRLSEGLSRLGIKGCLLTSESDIKWGERTILLLELDSAVESTDEEKSQNGVMSRVDALARSILPPHEVPKEYQFIKALPRTPSGKLKRH